MIRAGLAILRMEVEQLGGKRLRESAIVNVEIEVWHVDGAFIRYRDPCVFLKRHGEEAIQSSLRRYRERSRLIHEVVAEAEPEEIAKRALDTGCSFAVPIDAKNQRLQRRAASRPHGGPDMGDLSGTCFVHEQQRFAGRDSTIVGIPAAAVVARRALLRVVPGLRQAGKPVVSVLGKSRRTEREVHQKQERIFHGHLLSCWILSQ